MQRLYKLCKSYNLCKDYTRCAKAIIYAKTTHVEQKLQVMQRLCTLCRSYKLCKDCTLWAKAASYAQRLHAVQKLQVIQRLYANANHTLGIRKKREGYAHCAKTTSYTKTIRSAKTTLGVFESRGKVIHAVQKLQVIQRLYAVRRPHSGSLKAEGSVGL